MHLYLSPTKHSRLYFIQNVELVGIASTDALKGRQQLRGSPLQTSPLKVSGYPRRVNCNSNSESISFQRILRYREETRGRCYDWPWKGILLQITELCSYQWSTTDHLGRYDSQPTLFTKTVIKKISISKKVSWQLHNNKTVLLFEVLLSQCCLDNHIAPFQWTTVHEIKQHLIGSMHVFGVAHLTRSLWHT